MLSTQCDPNEYFFRVCALFGFAQLQFSEYLHYFVHESLSEHTSAEGENGI